MNLFDGLWGKFNHLDILDFKGDFLKVYGCLFDFLEGAYPPLRLKIHPFYCPPLMHPLKADLLHPLDFYLGKVSRIGRGLSIISKSCTRH